MFRLSPRNSTALLTLLQRNDKIAPIHHGNARVGMIVLFVFLLIILETLGNFLLYCIIFFEKFGMDAQKRTVTNQLFSRMMYVLILNNLFIIPTSLSFLFGFKSKFFLWILNILIIFFFSLQSMQSKRRGIEFL